jgi:hypothetical protein
MGNQKPVRGDARCMAPHFRKRRWNGATVLADGERSAVPRGWKARTGKFASSLGKSLHSQRDPYAQY